MNNKRKEIFTGVEDFKELIDNDGYFVDKTLMIRQLFERNALVTLFARPCRFGKTLNQSMIRRFLEDERTEHGERIDNSYLFDGLNISGCSEDILRHQQQYPVIFLSLKSAKQPDYDNAYKSVAAEICREFERHRYVITEDMSERDRSTYERILLGKGTYSEYAGSLEFLSQCLAKYHGRNTYILVDDYDLPLDSAYAKGFYDKMKPFILSLLGVALKGNPYLEKGIMTGRLHIREDSMVGGFNNFYINDVLGTHYGDSFGFTQYEVESMLDYYNLSNCSAIVNEWYGNYLFCNSSLYSPWSVLSYTKTAVESKSTQPAVYLPDTLLDDTVIRPLSNYASIELETLLSGGSIEKQLCCSITCEDISAHKWSFLALAGLLRVDSRIAEGYIQYFKASIPNKEIAGVYRNSLSALLSERIANTDRSPLINALETGDCEAAMDFIDNQLMYTICYAGYTEGYYLGFLVEILSGIGDYDVLSNRDDVNGRTDIVLPENKLMGRAIILELKVADVFKDMELKCREALEQIENRKYAQHLEYNGSQEILKYAVCFFKKGCIVMK